MSDHVPDADRHTDNNGLSIPSFEEPSFLEAEGSPFPSFGHHDGYHAMLPEKLEMHQAQVRVHVIVTYQAKTDSSPFLSTLIT